MTTAILTSQQFGEIITRQPSRQWPVSGGTHLEYDHDDGTRTILFQPRGASDEAFIVEHWYSDLSLCIRPFYNSTRQA